MAYLLLGVGQLTGLLIIPFGWPGLWLQLASLALFGWWTGFEPIGAVPLGVLVGIAVITELFDAVATAGRVERSRRRTTSVGGLVGGLLGAAFGLGFPLLGSLFGAVVGALGGALLAALLRRTVPVSARSVAGEVMGIAVRTGSAVAVAVFTLLTLMR